MATPRLRTLSVPLASFLLVTATLLVITTTSDSPARAAFAGTNMGIGVLDRTDGDLLTVDPATGAFTQLDYPAVPELDRPPSFSPSGFDFASTSSDRVVVVTGAQEARELADVPGGAGFPTWHPDEMEILVTTGEGDLVGLPVAGGPARMIMSAATLAAELPDFEFSTGAGPVWHPDADRIAAVALDDETGITHVVEVDAAGRSADLLTGPEGGTHPDYSPDGEQLVFERDPDDAPLNEIVLANSDGSEPAVYASDSYRPFFSPDGEQLAYTRVSDPTGDQIAQLVTRSVAGGAARVVIGSDLDDFIVGTWQAGLTQECGGASATVFPEDPLGTEGETIFGTEGDDVIVGGLGPDTIVGLGGDDIICGSFGDDTIGGGPGDDRVFGDDGNDDINAGGGSDVVHGGPGNDSIVAGNGDDEAYGEGGADGIFGGRGSDLLLGVSGADVIAGGPGVDLISGGTGRDELTGGGGDDVVDGQAGRDQIAGGPGKDILGGGPGSDLMRGQGGADRIRGGGGDDLIVGGAGRDLLRGQAGRDRIKARDGRRDGPRVVCGAARDVAVVDRFDRVRGCEIVRRR